MKIMKHKFFVVLTFIYLLVAPIKSTIKLQDLETVSPQNGPINFISEFTMNSGTSFLETNESLEEKTEELSKLSSSMNTLIMMQEASRKKKRYTDDGRLCASAFVQDGQTYFDCTSSRSPDGQNKNKEWCYVDGSAKGEKPWDYCKPIMDYDKIREENQNQMKQFTIEARKTGSEIEAQIQPAQQAIDDLKKVKKGQAELDTTVNSLMKEITTINNNMQNLFNTKEQWEKEEEKAVDVATKIEARKQKKKAEEASNKPTEMDKSEDTIKKEIAAHKATIAPHIQERLILPGFDCNGMLMYEEDPKGDGILGQYFDNESFLGDYKEQKDSNINFDWTGASPIDGINPNNYSVRWEGFLYAPITSNYQFAIECDDGASITVNNQILVSHNMFTAFEESKERVEKWLSLEVEKKSNPTKNFNKSTSPAIKLTGGEKYKIVVSYYHSVHDDIQDDEKSFIKLYWQSEDFDERVISKDYLYTLNSYPPLKLSGFTSETGVVRRLLENDLAFKNTEEYILQDIPTDFKGALAMKLNSKYMEKQLVFSSNIPVVVFLARLAHYPNPVPRDFENTGEYMSLLQVQKPNPTSPNKKNVTSDHSGLMKIYKKKFDAGQIKIPLGQKGINVKGIPLVLFFGFDSQTSSPVSCGGKEEWISKPDSAHYKGCDQSSIWSSNWKCTNGLNGKNKDSEGSMWAAKREGVGAWLSVEFKNLYQVSKIIYVNRNNPSERNSEISAVFAGGEEILLKLNNQNEAQEFPVDPPIKTNSVKFVIKGVYGVINNGGSFQVFGTKCIDADEADNGPNPEAKGLEKIAGVNPKKMKPLFKIEDKSTIVLSCKDSLSNTKKLDHIKQKPGNKVIVKCVENCANSPYSIYGDGKYSKDSSICKAAYHSQRLKANGGLVEIVFQIGRSSYKGSTKNGIRSKNKGKSDITLTFKPADEKDDIIVKNGSKVDIKQNGKWMPGVIASIKENKHAKILEISIEGTDGGSNKIQVAYPDKSKLLPCGEYVKDRDCKGSRLNPNKNKPIKIKFAPSNYNKPGDYLLDKGEVFGKHGQPYGWSKDMTNRMRLKNGVSKPELETFVEFPPSPLSRFCNKPTPDVICDKVTWSIKTGHGKFYVKLYIGDPEVNTRLDLKVNDDYIVKEKTISKGELALYEGAYDSMNEYIIITSECVNDCEYSMSKLNMVEIFPYTGDDNKKEAESAPEKIDPCKNGQSGGRCDKGPDVTHCIFDDPTAEGARFCTGELIMIQVSKQYKCPSQRDKFKCVKRQYKDQGECLEFCPGKCASAICNQ